MLAITFEAVKELTIKFLEITIPAEIKLALIELALSCCIFPTISPVDIELVVIELILAFSAKRREVDIVFTFIVLKTAREDGPNTKLVESVSVSMLLIIATPLDAVILPVEIEVVLIAFAIKNEIGLIVPVESVTVFTDKKLPFVANNDTVEIFGVFMLLTDKDEIYIEPIESVFAKTF